jgi:hypothetical protein
LLRAAAGSVLPPAGSVGTPFDVPSPLEPVAESAVGGVVSGTVTAGSGGSVVGSVVGGSVVGGAVVGLGRVVCVPLWGRVVAVVAAAGAASANIAATVMLTAAARVTDQRGKCCGTVLVSVCAARA